MSVRLNTPLLPPPFPQGMVPELRKELWPLLLEYHDWNASKIERMKAAEKGKKEFLELKSKALRDEKNKKPSPIMEIREWSYIYSIRIEIVVGARFFIHPSSRLILDMMGL